MLFEIHHGWLERPLERTRGGAGLRSWTPECVICLSLPQFPHLWKGATNSTCCVEGWTRQSLRNVQNSAWTMRAWRCYRCVCSSKWNQVKDKTAKPAARAWTSRGRLCCSRRHWFVFYLYKIALPSKWVCHYPFENSSLADGVKGLGI